MTVMLQIVINENNPRYDQLMDDLSKISQEIVEGYNTARKDKITSHIFESPKAVDDATVMWLHLKYPEITIERK